LASVGPPPVVVRPRAPVPPQTVVQQRAPEPAVLQPDRLDEIPDRFDDLPEQARPSRRRRPSLRGIAAVALVPLALGVSFSYVQKHWRPRQTAAFVSAAAQRQPPVNVRAPRKATSGLTLPRAAGPRARFFNDVVAVSVVSHRGQATLHWLPPRQFDHVAIVRRPGVARSRRSEVYSGRGTSFTDRAVKKGIDYRYLLIAYDRRGRRSRGVALCLQGPTSLLSRACSRLSA
jgi:hypothetical protein